MKKTDQHIRKGVLAIESGQGRIRPFFTGILLPALVLCFVCGTASAQNQGTIAGNVQDPSGALVPGANITAKNAGTGATYQTVSSSAGAYVLSNVNIGGYDITVTAPGF